jgi:hypothetical protein
MPLATADLSADTETLVYTLPAGKKASVNISICARSQAAQIRLAVTGGSAPTDADWIEYDASLARNGVLERTQIWLDAGECIYARANEAGVSVVVYGPVENG